MTVVKQILDQMEAIAKPQRKFFLPLFVTILSRRGRVNFRNLARYAQYSERTVRRQFQRDFDFMTFNRLTIKHVTTADSAVRLAQDASFIPKSGKQTYGLDNFWNGCTQRNERGLARFCRRPRGCRPPDQLRPLSRAHPAADRLTNSGTGAESQV